MSACRLFRAWYAADAAASSVDGGTSPGSDKGKPAGAALAFSVTGSDRGMASAGRGSASMTPSGARGDRGTPTMRTLWRRRSAPIPTWCASRVLGA